MRRGTDVHTIAPAATKMTHLDAAGEVLTAFLVAEVVLVVRLSRSVVMNGERSSAARMFTTDSTRRRRARPTEPVEEICGRRRRDDDNRRRHARPTRRRWADAALTRHHFSAADEARALPAPEVRWKASVTGGSLRSRRCIDVPHWRMTGNPLTGDDGEAAERKLLLHRVRREES